MIQGVPCHLILGARGRIVWLGWRNLVWFAPKDLPELLLNIATNVTWVVKSSFCLSFVVLDGRRNFKSLDLLTVVRVSTSPVVERQADVQHEAVTFIQRVSTDRHVEDTWVAVALDKEQTCLIHSWLNVIEA